MKTIFFLFLAIMLFISCDKNNQSGEIKHEDLSASVSMTSELTAMQQSLNSLVAAQGLNQRQFWDSAYHYHDSLFWHHHNNYHHNTYVHDDHNHRWVAYDPGINHHYHYHHPYPGHLNDSLVTTPNSHHHTDCAHHPGHHICHHHTMDSIHHVHNIHHP